VTGNTESMPPRARFGQDTIAIIATIVTVGLAIAGLMLTTTNDLREEARADRAAWQAENRRLGERFDRSTEIFQRAILRLTEGQARLDTLVSARGLEDESTERTTR